MLRRLAVAALLVAVPAAAADVEANGIRISGAHAFSAGPAAPTGAVYMAIANVGDAPDRLLAVEGAAARRIELHAHRLEDGIARMSALEGGIEIPAGETVILARGGLHVMLMGLAAPLEDGAEIALTLVFERAGRVPIAAPVDFPGPAPAAQEHGH